MFDYFKKIQAMHIMFAVKIVWLKVYVICYVFSLMILTFTQGHNYVSNVTNALICTWTVISRKIFKLWHSNLAWRLTYAWDIYTHVLLIALFFCWFVLDVGGRSPQQQHGGNGRSAAGGLAQREVFRYLQHPQGRSPHWSAHAGVQLWQQHHSLCQRGASEAVEQVGCCCVLFVSLFVLLADCRHERSKCFFYNNNTGKFLKHLLLKKHKAFYI